MSAGHQEPPVRKIGYLNPPPDPEHYSRIEAALTAGSGDPNFLIQFSINLSVETGAKQFS